MGVLETWLILRQSHFIYMRLIKWLQALGSHQLKHQVIKGFAVVTVACTRFQFCYLLLNLIILKKPFNPYLFSSQLEVQVPIINTYQKGKSWQTLLAGSARLRALCQCCLSRGQLSEQISCAKLSGLWEPRCCLHVPHACSSWLCLQWRCSSCLLRIKLFPLQHPGN